MSGKTLRNFIIIYLIILLAVIVMQFPKKDLSADEPAYKVEIDDENLDKSIIMNVNSPVVFVGSEQNLIDSSDVDIVPKIVNGSTYVPIMFFNNVLRSTVSWDAAKKETTVRYNNKAVVFTTNSDIVKVIDNDTDKTVRAASAPIIVRDRMYVPLRISLESFGKHIIYKDGLIIISDFDVEVSDDAIEEFVKKTAKLPVVGTEKNFEMLMGEPQENSRSHQKYVLNEELDYAVPEMSVNSARSAVDAPALKGSSASSSMAAGAAEKEASESGDYSKTNVQVEGVDEGDIIKTDGKYIYYVRNDAVELVDAYPPENMSLSTTVEPMSEMYGKNCTDFDILEIYVDDGKLVVVGEASFERSYKRYENLPEYQTEETTESVSSTSDRKNVDYYIPDYYYGNSYFTFADIYDITDRAAPKLVKQVISDGEYLSSRLTGGSVYLVSNVSIDSLVYNGKYITPLFYDSVKDSEPNSVDFSEVCYIPEKTTRNYMNIAGVDLSALDKPASVYTTVASGDEVYMSPNNLYVADSRSYATEIYKYELNKGSVSYNAHGKVEGMLHNQFSMDEKDNYFRITTSEYSNGVKSNNLFVLDDKLDKVSEIRDIAPDEDIHSTRFMGNRAYMVTFETVDPLFVIDVADPLNPKILGALKIPGYSDYLHPYDENHLIGIGKDTFVYGDMAYYKGIKLSMFDVSDVENPTEMFNEIIGDRGTESEVLDNHRALLFDKERNLIAFPIEIYTLPEEYKNKNSTEPTRDDLMYGTFTFQGFLRYSVDLENGFVFESKTTHLTGEDMLKAGNYRADMNKYITRGLLIGDNLYTISDHEIMAEDLDSEKTLGKVYFDER